MIVYHGIYDCLLFSGSLRLVFTVPFLIWEASIAWTFIFVAGWMSSFSSNNICRGIFYLLVALLIFAATSFAGIDTPISFGIIFLIGASSLIVGIIKKIAELPANLVVALVIFLLFLFFYFIPEKRIGIGIFSAPIPPLFVGLYGHGFAFLCFPSNSFAAGDYFPLIPFFFLFLAGAIMGNRVPKTTCRRQVFSIKCRPINWLGRHSLGVYLLHQPILFVLFFIILSLNNGFKPAL